MSNKVTLWKGKLLGDLSDDELRETVAWVLMCRDQVTDDEARDVYKEVKRRGFYHDIPITGEDPLSIIDESLKIAMGIKPKEVRIWNDELVADMTTEKLNEALNQLHLTTQGRLGQKEFGFFMAMTGELRRRKPTGEGDTRWQGRLLSGLSDNELEQILEYFIDPSNPVVIDKDGPGLYPRQLAALYAEWRRRKTNVSKTEIDGIVNTVTEGIKKIVEQLEKTYERDKRIAISCRAQVVDNIVRDHPVVKLLLKRKLDNRTNRVCKDISENSTPANR